MTNIKTTIQFSEYKAAIKTVMDNVFIDNIFYPENIAVSKRLAAIQIFAPDFIIPDDNEGIWSAMYSEEAEQILFSIEGNKQYCDLKIAIDMAIEHELKKIEASNSFSFEKSLSKLIDTLNSKAEQVELTQDSLNAFIAIADKVNSPEFEGNLVDALNKRGMLQNVAKQPKKSKGKTTTKTYTKKKDPIKIDVDNTKE